ncbi:retron St85 family RNA-directed DNA polymerase [Labrys sp. KNU-23]|uniref:retron St85 family RNA-directed DNA polymerase n=1 Tax=Labrys sp. KNU-23 TaxID=2789216 RepID=UPI00165ABA35|nr:retron St85 family RNA-directed DNA polymerase [Labrys sp. KNU-23]
MKFLIQESGLSEQTIKRIAIDAPQRYKAYEIKKKNGGVRQIAHPARELKILQRAIVKHVISGLPVHDAAMAYRKGRNIRDNAKRHAGTSIILKMDFKDFFPSIKAQDWHQYCEDNRILTSSEDIWLTSQILFYRARGTRLLRLAIGAPSSPALSNALLYDFDKRVTELVSQEEVVYTRYADDLTFSAARTGYLTGIQKLISRALREMETPKIKLNHKKTTHVTTKYSRNVTGLVLSNDGRVTIGRERKRKIRAMIDHFIKGRLNNRQKAHLSGMIAFAKSAEPEYYTYISEKYNNVLREILNSRAKKTCRIEASR